MSWQIGKSIQQERYKIEEIIGGGGFGITYLAKDSLSNTLVAIKTLNATVQIRTDFPEHHDSRFKGDKLPVESVSWEDAVEFCARLSKATRKEYGLPSEAQWEYACRAGTTTPFNFGETISSDLANYNSNYTYQNESKGKYREHITEVGSFLPNGFGLYDMHGNVWEWCADTYHENYQGAPNDGSVWGKRTNIFVLRGGSWNQPPGGCRSSYRSWGAPDYLNSALGFRCVLLNNS
jgi:formylglycine-generating enzyme required for sulfatase activity